MFKAERILAGASQKQAHLQRTKNQERGICRSKRERMPKGRFNAATQLRKNDRTYKEHYAECQAAFSTSLASSGILAMTFR
jgi:hypothetical protein